MRMYASLDTAGFSQCVQKKRNVIKRMLLQIERKQDNDKIQHNPQN